jgi:hypothetical protein
MTSIVGYTLICPLAYNTSSSIDDNYVTVADISTKLTGIVASNVLHDMLLCYLGSVKNGCSVAGFDARLREIGSLDYQYFTGG